MSLSEYFELSKTVTLQEVLENPNKPWCRECLSQNPDISFDFTFNAKLPNAIGNYQRNVIYRTLSMDKVLSNPDYEWDLELLSQNPRINKEVVNAHLPNSTGKWSWWVSKVI